MLMTVKNMELNIDIFAVLHIGFTSECYVKATWQLVCWILELNRM